MAWRPTWPPGWISSGCSFAGLFATEDQRTGMRSFLENGPGKATFSGPVTLARRPQLTAEDASSDDGAGTDSPSLDMVTAALRADSSDIAIYAQGADRVPGRVAAARTA